MLEVALAVATTVVAVAFALSTLDRWLTGRRPYELAWTVAFVFFALAAASLATGAQAGWSGAIFRSFYLFGAVCSVPLLALGQLLLLRRGRPSVLLIAGVGAFALFSAGVIVSAPFTAPIPQAELVQGSDVFGPLPRILAAIGSGLGALVVLTGTVYSALRRRNRRNIAGNLLLALGVVVSGASGLLNSVVGAMTAFAVTTAVGLFVLFAGFLVLTSRGKPPGEGANVHVP